MDALSRNQSHIVILNRNPRSHSAIRILNFAPLSLELERERTVQTLCSHFAQDHLSTQELEARFERVYRAKSFDELRALTAELPALPVPAPGSPPSPAPAPFYAMSSGIVPPPREKRFLALMSEVRRQGMWEVPQRVVARAIMGAIRLDLRDGVLPQGGIDVEADAFMGEVKIILPPGVRADVDGMAIMGEFSDRSTAASAPNADAPIVRIHGSAIMGSVNVETRLPNEGALEAWKRRLLKG